MTILEAHYDAAIAEEIRTLASERNAVVLAHNYERPEIQDVADYVGDSLGLSREAAKTDADVIVFCGVHFMAETAAILSPKKTVLLPDLGAVGCALLRRCVGNGDAVQDRRKLVADGTEIGEPVAGVPP